MARLEIKSKIFGRTFNFWMPKVGGYITLETADHPQDLGRMICDGGLFYGEPYKAATEEEFKKICRRWYRQHVSLRRAINDLVSRVRSDELDIK